MYVRTLKKCNAFYNWGYWITYVNRMYFCLILMILDLLYVFNVEDLQNMLFGYLPCDKRERIEIKFYLYVFSQILPLLFSIFHFSGFNVFLPFIFKTPSANLVQEIWESLSKNHWVKRLIYLYDFLSLKYLSVHQKAIKMCELDAYLPTNMVCCCSFDAYFYRVVGAINE